MLATRSDRMPEDDPKCVELVFKLMTAEAIDKQCGV